MRFIWLLAVMLGLSVQPAAAVTILLNSPDAATGVHQKITLTGLGSTDRILATGNLGTQEGRWWEQVGSNWLLNGNTYSTVSCDTNGPRCTSQASMNGPLYPVSVAGSLALQIIDNAIYVDWLKTPGQDICNSIAVADRTNQLSNFCALGWRLNSQGLTLDVRVIGPNASTFGYSVETLDSGPAVPEPATWLLMILGIGAIGSAMRRQRAAVAYSLPTA